MPWTDAQRAVLHELGLTWAPLLPGLPDELAPAPAETGPAAAAAGSGGAAGLRTSVTAAGAEPAAAAAAAPADAVGAAAQPTATSEVRVRDAVEAGSPPPAAGLDWAGLRAAVAACEACALCRTRRQTVFGVGSTRAHWMIVGEAPGEQEDLKGEPFVGAAGRLLDAMLSALGLTRREPPEGEGDDAQRVYIANTLKCRPPGNRNPQPDELARCEPFLLRQVELLRPRIIVAMGRFAVQSLLRSSEPIGRLRGHVHAYHGVPLIVTYHPAYLLRNPSDKSKAWADLCLAAATYEAGATPGAGA